MKSNFHSNRCVVNCFRKAGLAEHCKEEMTRTLQLMAWVKFYGEQQLLECKKKTFSKPELEDEIEVELDVRNKGTMGG